MTVRICLWSGPRNISTATMRSWENRADTAVWDEPFYGPYLVKTGVDHPGREDFLPKLETDPDAIAAACAGEAPDGAAIFFQKHMCQHMLDDIDRSWMAKCRHLFLIRDPEEVAASWYATTGQVTEEDLGAARQRELFDTVTALTGAAPPVVEGRDVQDDPEGMTRAICAALGVDFVPAMLSWPAGKRDSDGAWAPWWYARVEASTGFEAYRPSGHERPEAIRAVVEACRPHYEALRVRKLAPSP
jgi:hypothetical protein